MSISVTKKQENFSPLKWAAVGAAAGCIVKDVHPITQSERDFYEYDEAARKKAVRSMVDAEIAEFKNILGNKFNKEGHDAYVSYIKPPKSKEAREEYIKTVYAKLSEEAKVAFDILRNHVDPKVRAFKKQQAFMFEALVKKNRSTATYAIIGGLITTGAAFITYVISKMSNSAKD